MAVQDRRLLARRIKERRLALGLTQNDLAGNDFTRGFISQIENGTINPSLKSLKIIAERLGTSVSFFLTESVENEPTAIYHLITEANSHRNKNDFTAALDVARKAYEMASSQPDLSVLAKAQRCLGWIYLKMQKYDDAANYLLQAAESFHKAEDFLETARAYNVAGTAYHYQSKINEAIKAYRAGLKFVQDSDEGSQEWLRLTTNLALAYALQKDFENAIPLLETCINKSRNSMEYYRLGDLHNALGYAYKSIGNIEAALIEYERARYFYKGIPHELNVANVSTNLAIALRTKGDLNQARSLLEEAIDIYRRLERVTLLANAQSELAKIAWSAGDVETAEQNCREAISNLKNNQDLGEMKLLLARILASRNELEPAAEAYKESLDILSKSQDDASIAEICYEAGNVFLKLGKPEEASHYLARAADSYRKMSK